MTCPTPTRSTKLSRLMPHPRDYRGYPAARVAHLAEMIRTAGFVRHVTTADDGTVLAGWDIVLAARELGLDRIPVARLGFAPDDPRALKVLASERGDGFEDIDDRALVDLLREVKDTAPGGLAGTGFDDMQLAALAMVTRPRSEVEDFDAAAHWVGLPAYKAGKPTPKLVISFDGEADRESFLQLVGIAADNKGAGSKTTLSARWPARRPRDLVSVRFEG